jgi:Asp-tRNA(Asn)/Glu-tRNA(Gln) amidotransferase C subunit
MEKTMPLDLLSSIKGARSSEAVSELFEVIKKAIPEKPGKDRLEPGVKALSINELRKDEVRKSDEREAALIRKNFPGEKNGFLVVPKVMEE